MAEGSPENNSVCERYHTSSYQKIAIVAASSGSFSLLASLAVILVIVIFKKYNFFIQRLILYLCIAAALNSVSIVLRFSQITQHSEDENLHRLCIATAFIDQTTLWSLNIAFCCMTFNMLITVVFNRSTNRLELGYIFLIFVLPITYNWIPFLHESYGEAGAWCWITSVNHHDPNCTVLKFGMYLQYALWYVPHYILLGILLVGYIVVVIVVIRKTQKWKGLYSTEIETEIQKEHLKEMVMPLIFYPIGFFILNLFPLINRIYNNSDISNLVLWYLHAVFSPLQGGLIALVYVLDKGTMKRLTLKELRAYLFHRSTPVRDYPVKGGLTDSYEEEKPLFSDESISSSESVAVTMNKGKKGLEYGSIDKKNVDKYSLSLKNEERT